MSSQVPADGLYYVKMSESSAITITRLREFILTNIDGREYDTRFFTGVKFGCRIPTDSECSAFEAILTWARTIIELGKSNPQQSIGSILALHAPPKDLL